MDRLHTSSTKWVKSHLPRRESERRSHPLARHCDILSGIETRLSLLSMTYTKYIESNSSCFIPGKVLDEVVRILNLVYRSAKATLESQSSNLPRAHELLQELRDISSMAMEHFDEKIVPIIRHRAQLPSSMSLSFNPSTMQFVPSSSPSRSSYSGVPELFRAKLPPLSPHASSSSPCGSPSSSPFSSHHHHSLPLLQMNDPASAGDLGYGNSSLISLSGSGVATNSVPKISVPATSSLAHVTLGEFALFKKKMTAMKRKADDLNRKMEERIVQQNTVIQTQNLTIHTQGVKIAKLERRIDRMTKKFLDCNAKVEDILRCGQTGIKLKRKVDADVGLLSGDESEGSPNPSVGDDADDDVDDVEDAKESAFDSASLPNSASFPAVTTCVSVSTVSSPPSTSSVSSSLISVGNLTRSPIKLRLRQTTSATCGLDADQTPSCAAAPASHATERRENDGDLEKISEEKVLPESESVRGKAGKSTSLKRKGKSAAAKTKGAEKETAEGKEKEKSGATTSSLAQQRKRVKF